MSLNRLEDYFPDWKAREALAEAMVPMIGKLNRERNIVTHIYGRPLTNRGVIHIMKNHRFVRQVAKNELSEFESYPILKALCELELGPAYIDIGKLAVSYMEDSGGLTVEEYLVKELADLIEQPGKPLDKPQDVVLYGFGRIGRLVARLLIEHTGSGDSLRLRAVGLAKHAERNLVKRAASLRRDSVHGSFHGTIRCDEDNHCMIINGNVVHLLYEDPDKVDYRKYGIDNAILIDNTGAWTDYQGLSQHLKAKGIAKVILTAPGKDADLKDIVYGINHDLITDDDKIICAASCTTNAVVPVLKAMHDRFGVQHGHMETVHAYTNDQNLIDNFHKKPRRGRSAALNMVLTSSGATKAVAKALPELAGKLTGNAIRVPTPDVSMAILNLTLDKSTSAEEVNTYLRDIALHSDLQQQIDFNNSPEVVSSDIVGERATAIVDGPATIVEQNRCVLYVWYDNEFGYSAQVLRIAKHMAGIRPKLYPQKAYENAKGWQLV